MNEEQNLTRVPNPHDKLFREVWGDLENVRGFLQEYLPADQLVLMDPASLEICKDSFIEKELEDYYSDMLYKVRISGTSGYLYVLFEHKSYDDKYLHLQLLEYMVKIWRLFLKQQPENKKKPPLPIVLPLLICHGETPWPKDRIRFSSLMSGPVETFSAYIPDFSFSLHDLTDFTDVEIRGTIMVRVMQLLFKHIREPDLMDNKLPGILSLLREVMSSATGLHCLEIVLRYLFGTREDASAESIKNIVELALTQKEGGYVMTLAEKLRKEGERRGEKEGRKK
ncbi:conserved hypothetical protein [Desulfamplus magnetovallimortis]|uniref:Transposase (putative) YhgA-like domain-containing protein n=1 Tax=Desulfamplus magnetovallimortis TaxID=1246637 RepID=A0A1W1H8G7_9BACT|nr:Rpn family recombination-promoting nuclease/putative transposase [Desulfamplus magnetovallimortis]SLM28675.1 conserved hypothetical protein [Desulfamplus magnetovallimortis]